MKKKIMFKKETVQNAVPAKKKKDVVPKRKKADKVPKQLKPVKVSTQGKAPKGPMPY